VFAALFFRSRTEVRGAHLIFARSLNLATLEQAKNIRREDAPCRVGGSRGSAEANAQRSRFCVCHFFSTVHMTARISDSADYLLRLLSFQTEISTRPTRYQFNVGDLRPHFGAFATLCLGVASSTAEP
jgi:hypothetical protein